MPRRRSYDQGFTGEEEEGYGEEYGMDPGWMGTTTDPVTVPEPIPDPVPPPPELDLGGANLPIWEEVPPDWRPPPLDPQWQPPAPPPAVRETRSAPPAIDFPGWEQEGIPAPLPQSDVYPDIQLPEMPIAVPPPRTHSDSPWPPPERAPGPEYPAPPDGPPEPGPPLPLPDPGPYPPLPDDPEPRRPPPLPAPPRLPSPPPAPGPPRPVPPDEQILERSFGPPDFREPFFEGRDFQPREDPGTIFSDFSPTAALPQTADKKLYQSDDPEEPGYGTTESFGDINPPFTAWPSDGMGETGGEDYPDEAGIPGVRRRRPGSELLDEEEVAAQRQEDEQRAEEYVPPPPPEPTPAVEPTPTAAVPTGAPEGVDPADPKWAQWQTESGRVPNEENIISFLQAHFGDQHSKAGLQAALPYLQWIFGEGIRIHPHEAGDTLVLPDGSLIDVIAGVKGPTGGESWIWIPDADEGGGGGHQDTGGAGDVRRRSVDWGELQDGGGTQFAGYPGYQGMPGGGMPGGGTPFGPTAGGADPLSQMTDRSLAAMLQSGGVAATPMAGTIEQTLQDILSSGGQLPALEARRDRDRAMAIESARSPLDIMRRAQMSQGRAALASRGLVGGGAEREYGERLEERLAPQYTAAAQRIEMRERDREEQRLSNAMSLSSGMSQEQSRNLLNTARTVNERQQMLSNIAMRSLDQNMAWNRFLAEFGLNRFEVLERIQQGRLGSLLPLLQQYLGTASQAASGFAYTD